MSTTPPPALELTGVTKSYGPVHANRAVDLTLRRGTVHTILGENGAGKSTLMRILFGVERADSGQIRVDGVERELRTPRDAIAAGIGMVFQHFGLVDDLSALDNITLGAEPGSPVKVDRQSARHRVGELACELGLEVPLDNRVAGLRVAQQQRVEILKALFRDAAVLILDEPTALLTPQERSSLFAGIDRLRDRSVSVLFITHKLEEAEQLADDVTVMRHGRVVATYPMHAVTREQLVTDMLGRAYAASPAGERTTREPSEVAVSLRGVSAHGDGAYPLSGVDLDVRYGEILGVAGIDGHGHQLVCQVIAGVRQPDAGAVQVGARQPRTWSRRVAMRHGVSYVPEDRLAAGVARDASIADNLLANRRTDSSLICAGFLRRDRIVRHAKALIDQFDVRCRDHEQPVARLSGGNIQKVVLAREISVGPEVLVVCEPTRGLDVGAIAAVHAQLHAAAERGAAVVVQSSDLDEVVALADRVVVFREGSAVAELTGGTDLDATELGSAMLGTARQAAMS